MKIQERQHREYEAYRAYERERIITDEITDVSERIPLPMCNSFDYRFEADGELHFQGQSIGGVLRRGVEQAKLVAQQDPRFSRAYLHAEIELQEYDDQRRLALMGENDPDLLVVISPQLAEIGKKLTMVRIYQRNVDGISATSVSFERSEIDCLQNVVDYFGSTIEPGASVEDILAMRTWGRSDDVPGGDVRQFVARLHDCVLEEKYGGEWSGGRSGRYSIDAQTFTAAQQDLVSDHLGHIGWIKKKYQGDELVQKLEQQRYNFAAALTRRIRGQSDADSMDGAGAEARQNGEVYENSCPDGVSTAQSSLNELGLAGREWKPGSCRVCLRSGMVGECDVCLGCEEADNRGVDLRDINKKALRARERQLHAQQRVNKSRSVEERAPQRRPHLDFTEERTSYSIGGSDVIVYDRRSGQAIAKKTRSGYTAL